MRQQNYRECLNYILDKCDVSLAYDNRGWRIFRNILLSTSLNDMPMRMWEKLPKSSVKIKAQGKGKHFDCSIE